MPFRVGPAELILVLLIAILIFGPGRIAKIGGELGKSINAFQSEVKGDREDDAEQADEAEEM